MPSELSQTIVLADCNVAVVKLHRCGRSFVNRLSLVCRLTCVAVSVSLIRANSWWSLLFDCWGFNARVNHKACGCAQVKVKLSSLFCWISPAFNLCLERYFSYSPAQHSSRGTKTEVRIHYLLWSIKPLVQGNQLPQKCYLSGKLSRELSAFSQDDIRWSTRIGDLHNGCLL